MPKDPALGDNCSSRTVEDVEGDPQRVYSLIGA